MFLQLRSIKIAKLSVVQTPRTSLKQVFFSSTTAHQPTKAFKTTTFLGIPSIQKTQLQIRSFAEENESSKQQAGRRSTPNLDPQNSRALSEFFEPLDAKGRIRPAGNFLIHTLSV